MNRAKLQNAVQKKTTICWDQKKVVDRESRLIHCT